MPRTLDPVSRSMPADRRRTDDSHKDNVSQHEDTLLTGRRNLYYFPLDNGDGFSECLAVLFACTSPHPTSGAVWLDI